MAEPRFSPGLAGVIAGETAISMIDKGLFYRGISVEELAANSSFEETAFLLLHGDLPTPQALAEFCGRLFANAQLMFGEGARGWLLTLGDDYPGFLLAILPPGAFIGLGLLIALKNVIDRRLARVAAVEVHGEATTAGA